MNEKPLKFDAESVSSIVEHMNEDHADALMLYVKAFTSLNPDSIQNLHMLDMDSDGISLGYIDGQEPNEVRILFKQTIGTNLRSVSGARGALVRMVKLARQ